MIIIKYYEWLRLQKDAERFPIFEICNSKYEKIRTIDKAEAKRLIKENNLRLAFFSNDGAIYEQ